MLFSFPARRLKSLGTGLSVAAGITLAAASALAQSADPVTIRYLATRGGINPPELAQLLGYYDAASIKLEPVGYAGGGPESLFALASDSVDYGSAATPAVINSIAGGNDFVATNPSGGINQKIKSTFYVLEDSPIHTIEDLKGKTVAVNTLGAHLDYVIREALHQKNIPANTVRQVVVPGPQLEQTLRSHQVDVAAFGAWQLTFAGVLQKNGGVRAVFDDTGVLGDIALGYIVFRRDFVKAHPAALRAFIEGAGRAADWSEAHPDEAKKLIAKFFQDRGDNPEIAQFWTGFGLRQGALPVERDISFWLDVLQREGKLKQGQLTAAQVLLPGYETLTN